MNPQPSQDKLSWLVQAIIAKTNLKGGASVLEPDDMFRRIVAASYKARERSPQTGDFGEKGFHFHNIASVGDGVPRKPWTRIRPNLLFVGCEGRPFQGNRSVDIIWKDRAKTIGKLFFLNLQMVREVWSCVMPPVLGN